MFHYECFRHSTLNILKINIRLGVAEWDVRFCYMHTQYKKRFISASAPSPRLRNVQSSGLCSERSRHSCTFLAPLSDCAPSVFRKVKWSRYTPWWRLGWEEVQFLLILNFSIRWGWVVSITPRPRFTPGERTPGTHCTGGWVGPRAGLDAETRRKIICLCRGSNPGCPVRSQTLYWLSYPCSWWELYNIWITCNTETVKRKVWVVPGTWQSSMP
jgi:hypothetical protein